MGSKITKLTPMQGFCAETGGRDHAVSCDRPRHSCFDDAYNHWRHRWRRRRPQGIRGPLEHRQEHRRSLDHHHADGSGHCGYFLRAGEVGRMKFPKVKEKKTAANEPRRQYAALPWRIQGGPEILLLTSRDTRRWVIPKGGQ